MPNKPTTVPQLDTNSTNRTIPAPSKVTDGYVTNDILPSANANYLWGWAGDWFGWLNSTFGDGPAAGDLSLPPLDDTLPAADDSQTLGNRTTRWGDVYGSEGHFGTNGLGYTAMSRTMSGVELWAGGMSLSNAYTGAVKFMSTDPQLTTENPKLLAAIAGVASEAYGLDTSGGMGIRFFTTPNNPGATSVPLAAMTIEADQSVTFENGFTVDAGDVDFAAAANVDFAGGFVVSGGDPIVQRNMAVGDLGDVPVSGFKLLVASDDAVSPLRLDHLIDASIGANYGRSIEIQTSTSSNTIGVPQHTGIYTQLVESGTNTVSDAFGYRAKFRRISGTTTSYVAFLSEEMSVEGGTASLGTLRHFQANDISTNTGTTTSQYGLYVGDLQEATNNYGVYVAGAGTYSIWVDSGPCRFDDYCAIGAAPFSGNQLGVTMAQSGSGNQTAIVGQHNVVGDTTGTKYGIYALSNVDVNPGETSAAVIGINSYLDLRLGGTVTSYTGLRQYSDVGDNCSVGTMTNWFSGGIVRSAASVTTWYGSRISGPSNSGTVSALFGLYIDSLTQGSTNYALRILGASPGYAVYVDSGLNYFGGEVGLGKAPTAGNGPLQINMPTSDLHVTDAVATGAKSTQAGFITVTIGGVTRYIRTYSA